MNLDYAVERLYDTGWTPDESSSSSPSNQVETLPDGRLFPSVRAVENEFARAGLELSIQHTPKFNCYRATWRTPDADENQNRSGTVIGACQREAAVYALAQLRQAEQPLAVN
jgi:hypothetical protein